MYPLVLQGLDSYEIQEVLEGLFLPYDLETQVGRLVRGLLWCICCCLDVQAPQEDLIKNVDKKAHLLKYKNAQIQDVHTPHTQMTIKRRNHTWGSWGSFVSCISVVS